MADVSKLVEIVFKATDGATTVIKQVTDGVDALGDEASGALPGLKGLGDGVDGLGGKEGVVDGLATAFKALAAAVVVKEFIDANIEAEKFEKAMTLLKGSSEAAAAEFEYVRQLSNVLGLELFSTANAYTQLTAATKGTALEGQATRDIFEAVSVSMQTMGKSSADTEGALLAISQMVSKGTVSMEELRGQLGERLPGAFQTAATAMGVTTEELDDMVASGNVTADVFLPKFAQALRDTFGDTAHVDTYQAAWNRMQNSMSEAYIQIGQSGAFDAMTKGIELGTAAIVGAVAAFTLLGEIAGAVAGAIATGDFTGLGDAVDAAMSRAAEKTRGARDALFDAKQEAANLKYEGEAAGNKVSQGMEKAQLSAEDLAKAAKQVDGLLKELGIDPKQFEAPVERITQAFINLANNPAASGDQILAGFLVTLDKIKSGPDGLKDIEQAVIGLAAAQANGSLSTEQYTAALQALEVKNGGLWDSMIRTTDATKKQEEATKKQADEAKRAAEKAAELNLKLTELASNERIKLIEAQVSLDIAEVEANAQIAERILTNLSEMYEADVSLIGELTSQLGDGYSQADRFRMKMAEEASQRAGELHDAQLKVIDAQVEYMRAKTSAINAGNPVMTIQANGLEPHLEGMMWEVFKQIQIKMAQDGGDLIVGGISI